jgi:hypothetical protein
VGLRLHQWLGALLDLSRRIHLHLDPFQILSRRPIRYEILQDGTGDFDLESRLEMVVDLENRLAKVEKELGKRGSASGYRTAPFALRESHTNLSMNATAQISGLRRLVPTTIR